MCAGKQEVVLEDEEEDEHLNRGGRRNKKRGGFGYGDREMTIGIQSLVVAGVDLLVKDCFGGMMVITRV